MLPDKSILSLVNLHIIETKDNKFKFSILVNNIAFTDRTIYNNRLECITAASNLSEILSKYALSSIKEIEEWEEIKSII